MAKTVLILLDLINELIHDQGKFAERGYPTFVREHHVLENVSHAIAQARQRAIPIIFMRIGFSPDYVEWPETSPLLGPAREYGALQLGTWATEIHEDVERQPQDLVLTKHRVSAFYGTPLDLILRNLKAENLLLGGVSTDLVVQTTAREAHDRDYHVVVLEDLCGAGNLQEHEEAIRSLTKIAAIAKCGEVF